MCNSTANLKSIFEAMNKWKWQEMKSGFVFGDNSTVFLALPGFGSLLLNSVSHFAQIVDLSSEVFKVGIKISA